MNYVIQPHFDQKLLRMCDCPQRHGTPSFFKYFERALQAM